MNGLIDISGIMRPTYVLITDKFIIKTHTRQDLPTVTSYRDKAKAAAGQIDRARQACVQHVLLDTRAEYDAELKALKAAKKAGTIQLWTGGPQFDIKTLLELLTIFRGGGYYDPKTSRTSPLRLIHGNTECLFFPER